MIDIKNSRALTAAEYFGGLEKCVAVLEQETRVPKFHKMIDVIDNQFDSKSSSDLNVLMRNVQVANDRSLAALSGYAHLLLAEQMYQQKFDKNSINKEIDKATALLDYAHLGGKHPWLPRAMKLKRKINCLDYIKLCSSVILLVIAIIGAGLTYRYIMDSDFLYE